MKYHKFDCNLQTCNYIGDCINLIDVDFQTPILTWQSSTTKKLMSKILSINIINIRYIDTEILLLLFRYIPTTVKQTKNAKCKRFREYKNKTPFISQLMDGAFCCWPSCFVSALLPSAS